MFTRSLLGSVVVCGAWLAASAPAADHILAEKSVPILTSSEPTIFPEAWRHPPISASGKSLPPQDFERATTILVRALRKYPHAVLQRNLKAVYVLSGLSYSGIAAGGTNSRNVVYVQIGAEQSGYTDTQIEGVFHAEFSSILLRNFRRDFDAVSWERINPTDFRYSGNGVEAVRHHQAHGKEGETLYRQGFLHRYSVSALEEDFNAFAAVLFSGDPARWQLVEEHPRLQAKLRLALDFYARIDAKFTPAYFRHLQNRSSPSNEHSPTGPQGASSHSPPN